MKFKIYCVNRKADVLRYQRFDGKCRELGVGYDLVNAVDALGEDFRLEDYAEYLPKAGRFCERIPLGSFGNWMSQISVWKAIFSNEKPGLICEDDTVLNDRVFDLERVVEGGGDWDIVFCNNRCSPPSFVSGLIERRCDSLGVGWIPLAFLMQLQMLSMQSYTTPGADCYLVSVSGAKKLLAIAEEFGAFDYLDWMLIRYSLQGLRRSDFLEGNVRQPFHNMMNSAPLTQIGCKTYSLIRPVAHTMPKEVGGSVTKSDQNRGRYIDVMEKRIVNG